MKRERLFRAKEIKHNGDWVFGDYANFTPYPKRYRAPHIITEFEEIFEIDPKTMGQYTGLTDKNEVEIFEGDIVDTHRFGMAWGDETEIEERLIVRWIDENGCFGFVKPDYPNKDLGYVEFLMFSEEGVNVIGNIHDNPELLNNN